MENTEKDDRLSQLPEVILQHILHFLSLEEAVRTSILSRSWRYTWSTRPNIEFIQDLFEGTHESFISSLDKTLQVYHDQKMNIEEFRVDIVVDHADQTISLLQKWIPTLVLDMGVKKFDIKLQIYTDNMAYDLPQVLFEAKSLQKLHLTKCRLGKKPPPDKVLFKHLKSLSLSQVYVEDETFHKIISHCPLIECLRLNKCEGLRNIKVNNHYNLNEFAFTGYYDANNRKLDTSIEIDSVPNLETIEIDIIYTTNLLQYHRKFPNLKSLTLNEVRLSSKSFDYFSSDLHNLEKLSIQDCYGFHEFKLQSHTIKHFIFWGASKDMESVKGIMNTPNLRCFEFEGDFFPSLSFTRTWGMVSTITVIFAMGADDASSWFFKLHQLLKSLGQSAIFLTIVQCLWNNHQQVNGSVVLDNTCSYEPIMVQCLDVIDCKSICSALFNGIFRVCRPIRVCYSPSTDVDFRTRIRDCIKVVEFLCEKSIMVSDSQKGEQFWQKDLVEVNIAHGEGYLLGYSAISFQLKWRKACFLSYD